MRLVNPKLKLARDRKEKKQWCAILWTLSVTIREDSRNVHVSIGHKPKVHSKVLESAQYICKVQCMASKLASARHLTFAVNRSLARVVSDVVSIKVGTYVRISYCVKLRFLYCVKLRFEASGLALAGAGPNASPRRGATLSSGVITSSFSVNRTMTTSLMMIFIKIIIWI